MAGSRSRSTRRAPLELQLNHRNRSAIRIVLDDQTAGGDLELRRSEETAVRHARQDHQGQPEHARADAADPAYLSHRLLPQSSTVSVRGNVEASLGPRIPPRGVHRDRADGKARGVNKGASNNRRIEGRVACPRLRGHVPGPRSMPTKTWACHPTTSEEPSEVRLFERSKPAFLESEIHAGKCEDSRYRQRS